MKFYIMNNRIAMSRNTPTANADMKTMFFPS